MLRRNILIFHAAALGDFILTWPLATALGRIYAQSRIVYVTASQKGDLARQALGLDATDSETGWHSLFTENAQPPEPVSKWLAGANLIITFISTPGDTWHQNAQHLAPHAQIVSLHSRPENNYGHHITQFLTDQLTALPVLQQGVQQILASLSQRPIRSQTMDPTHILIHPGSGSPQKCWPPEKYLQLIQKLQQGGTPTRILLGEVERDQWPPAQIKQFESAAETVFPTTYTDLLTHLRQARAFVGNDTGPSHLAAIIGVPTLALFGPTNPTQWHPLGPHVTILHRPFPDLSVEEVLASLPPK